MLKRLSIISVGSIVILVSLIGSITTSKQAYAASPAPDKSMYLDQTVIYLKDTNRYYRDMDIFGKTEQNDVNWEHGYIDLNNPTGTDSNNKTCYNVLNVPAFNTPGTVVLHEYAQKGGKCTATQSKTYTNVDSKNFQVNAYQIDNKTIYMPQFLYDQCGEGAGSSYIAVCNKGGRRYTGADGRFEANNATDANYCPDGAASSGIDKDQCVDYGLISASGTGAGIAAKLPIKGWQGTLVYINTKQKIQYTQARVTYQVDYAPDKTTTFPDTGADAVDLVFANGRAITQPVDATGNPPSVADIASQDLPDDAPIDDCKFDVSIYHINNVPGDALNWFGCTVAHGIMKVVDGLTNQLQSYLEFKALDNCAPPVAPATSTPCAQTVLHSVWGNFLTIANILFVIGFLIMILSTALNLGVVDAYTVKKFLPRILIAVLLANLSWAIITTTVHITNDIGGSIQSIINIPINTMVDSMGAGSVKTALAGSSSSQAMGLLALGALIIPAIATGGIFFLVPAVMALLLAITITFGTIAIRVVILEALIIVAPLAIAAWVIPGLDNWPKRWWKLFLEMLMVYPIIIGFITLGRFAAILLLVPTGNGAVSTINGLLALGAYVIPLFILPAVFKMASGALGHVTGMVNDKGKGLFDRGSNWGRDKSQKTGKSLRKAGAKTAKENVRQQRFGAQGLDRTLTRGGVRGRMARRGLNEDDMSVLKAQRDRENLRVEGAQEESRKAQRAGHTLKLRNNMEARQTALIAGGDDEKIARTKVLKELEDQAVATDDNQEYFAIMQELGRQKATTSIGHVQERLADPSQGIAGATKWNAGVADNEVYGAMTSLDAGFGGGINPGMGHAAVAGKRLVNFNGKSDEFKAGSQGAAWKEAIHAAVTTGTAADLAAVYKSYNDIAANDNLKGQLNATHKDLKDAELDALGGGASKYKP